MIYIVIAKIALGHHPGFPIELQRAVGTSPLAVVAAHTPIRIDENDSILSLRKRPCGANPDTDRSLAVHTGTRQEVSEGLIDPGLPPLHPFAATDFHDPSPEYSNRKMVFIFAGDLTGLAAGAGS
ncbi:MAG: hypothetical protein A2Z14_10785 [Chloroflexi bacterium RBG_16_48_8]|nr:MAG: hypothetical protein A2Z14_10785 [Chloroflexi bacterium RBG_16_48_8]